MREAYYLKHHVLKMRITTFCAIGWVHSILATIDRKNNLIEVKGELIRSRKTSRGMFLCGIKFIGVDERMEHFISNLIKEYNFRRQDPHIGIRQKVDI